jgi:hypothetical protein
MDYTLTLPAAVLGTLACGLSLLLIATLSRFYRHLRDRHPGGVARF